MIVCLDVWPMSNETDEKGREMKPKPFRARYATQSREASGNFTGRYWAR
jgi:hypothetical protein